MLAEASYHIHEGLMQEQSGRRDTHSPDGHKEDRAPSTVGPRATWHGPRRQGSTPLMIRALWAAASLAISIRIEGKKMQSL